MPDLPPSPERDYTPKNLVTSAAGRGAEVRAHWDTDEVDAAEDDADYEALLDREQAQDERPQPGDDRDFVHLHVHSEYSLLDGLSPVGKIVSHAQQAGMKALALTDHGNLYGAIDFYDYARKAGIKPIIGVEAYVSPRGMTERGGAQDRGYYHLVLLAKDAEGYQNLLQLVTRANLEGYYYKPRMDRALLAAHSKGLIALSGCYSGEPSRAILESEPRKAREAAKWYREVFGEDYFLEIQDHGNPEDRIVNEGLLEIHRELGIPVVATNDTHYAAQRDADAQDMLLCIQTNSTIDDPKRMRMQPAAFYLKTPAEMWGLFGHIPQALTNTVAIADRCNLKLEFDRLNFPPLDHLVPRGEGPQHFLERVCRERLAARYGSRLTDTHRERLEYELSVIQQTGFASYILFVWDFVQWARDRGITCGPRGSAAGSIILYCLSISDVDPVGYGLTFERFLNPERIQMPDIDMDFADDRRADVIQYVVERYGRDRVAQIVTFGRLLARAAIRDVGRALKYDLGEVDRIAKLVPAIPIGLKLDQAIEQSPELERLYQGDDRVKTLIDAARSIEGVARHAGTHAAGVVVADEPLWNYVPLQKPTKGEGQMTQYSMKVLEKIGLLKMDFLGLANLTMLAKALQNITATRGETLDLVNGIPYDDPATYEMLSRGETKTVFQLEGSGMTRYIQDLKPSTVDHLAAMVALYRPGPMAHIPSYIARREGRERAVAPDPSLEAVLKESYGIIVYQDQVLQVVREVAGYSLGQADVLRRAMGKKDRAIMAEEGPKFIKAAVEHGYARETAEQLWELLQPFAGYAFNKAHAYCYAFLAYQTAYLKANYSVEWFAAVLSTIHEDTDKVVSVVGECRRMRLAILPPHINTSRPEFTVEWVPHPANPREARRGTRFGLCAVKNVGGGAVEHLVAERDAHGPFKSLDDLCRRVDLHTINKRVLESLIKCGAMDELGPKEAPRETLLRSLDTAMRAAQNEQKAASSGQTSLFDSFGGGGGATPAGSQSSSILAAAPAVPPRERAAWEKEVLGFHFSDHPYQEADAWLRGKVAMDLGSIAPDAAGTRVTIAGAVTGVRRIFTKTKGQMAVLTLEDLAGSVEVVVFPRSFEKTPDLWVEDKVLVIEGKIDARDERAQVLLEKAEEWSAPTDGSLPPTLSDGEGAGDAERAGPPPALPSPEGSRAVRQPNGHASRGGSANGHTNGSGHTPGARSESSVLVRVVVPRQDDAWCLRVLEQLHRLVELNAGGDRLHLVLHDTTGSAVELHGAEIAVRHSPELEAHVRTLVGDGNVQVQPLAA